METYNMFIFDLHDGGDMIYIASDNYSCATEALESLFDDTGETLDTDTITITRKCIHLKK